MRFKIFACIVTLAISACSGAQQSPTPATAQPGSQVPGAQQQSSTPMLLVTHQQIPAVTAYDEAGRPLPIAIDSVGFFGAFGIAFDPVTQVVFVTHGGSICLFNRDLTGFEGASCVPSPASLGMAFDPAKTFSAGASGALYVAGAAGPSIAAVFAHFGRSGLAPITPSGSFAKPFPSSGAVSVALDTFNHHLYFPIIANVNGGENNLFTVAVYDEDGNRITTAGTFPGLDQPEDIAFDSNNRHLYVANAQNNTVTVYDEDGNRISTLGNFAGLSIPSGIAFDPLNRQLYVVNQGTQLITIYDEEGHLLSTCGLADHAADPIQIRFIP